MTKPLITIPCTAQELENALHAACDHDGAWEVTVKVYMEFQNPDAEKYCEGKMYLVLCDNADNTKGEGEMTNENNVYRKYRILDATTGEEKHGKYFVLKIDAKDEKERECVKAAMNMYTMAHMNRGNTDYALAVDDYILGKTEGGAA